MVATMPRTSLRRMLSGALLAAALVLSLSGVAIGDPVIAAGRPFANPVKAVIAPMSNPYTVSGALTTISTPTYSWERQDGTVNEGPEPLYHNGKTFIVHSASACWGPNYKLGLLTYNGGNPLSASAWTKAAQPVIQRSDGNGVYGPGHNGFFTSPDRAEDWIVYHANDAAGDGCDNNRTTRAQRFRPVVTAQGDWVRLGNLNSGKVLDVADCGSADGAVVRQWSWLNNNCQQWRLQPV